MVWSAGYFHQPSVGIHWSLLFTNINTILSINAKANVQHVDAQSGSSQSMQYMYYYHGNAYLYLSCVAISLIIQYMICSRLA